MQIRLEVTFTNCSVDQCNFHKLQRWSVQLPQASALISATCTSCSVERYALPWCWLAHTMQQCACASPVPEPVLLLWRAVSAQRKEAHCACAWPTYTLRAAAGRRPRGARTPGTGAATRSPPASSWWRAEPRHSRARTHLATHARTQ